MWDMRDDENVRGSAAVVHDSPRINLADHAPTREDIWLHDTCRLGCVGFCKDLEGGSSFFSPTFHEREASDSAGNMSEERFLKPDHYAYSDHEPDDVIEAWGLEYRLGQVLRYLCRCDRKKNKLKDLKKAQWYLNREIEKLEKTV